MNAGTDPQTARRGSILLVDDEEKIRKTLGRVLRDEGHQVVDLSLIHI